MRVDGERGGGEALVCLVTAPRREARRIAEKLVGSGLAACCNVVDPVSSYYVWKGKMERDEEALLIIKTGEARARDLVSLIEDSHPYDLPEVILLPVAGGSEGYLDWVVRVCSHQAKED